MVGAPLSKLYSCGIGVGSKTTLGVQIGNDSYLIVEYLYKKPHCRGYEAKQKSIYFSTVNNAYETHSSIQYTAYSTVVGHGAHVVESSMAALGS